MSFSRQFCNKYQPTYRYINILDQELVPTRKTTELQFQIFLLEGTFGEAAIKLRSLNKKGTRNMNFCIFSRHSRIIQMIY